MLFQQDEVQPRSFEHDSRAKLLHKETLKAPPCFGKGLFLFDLLLTLQIFLLSPQSHLLKDDMINYDHVKGYVYFCQKVDHTIL